MSGHDRFEQLAASSLDFPLSDAESAELREHLARCIACARFEAALRLDADAAATRPKENAPARVRAAISAEVMHREPWVTTRRIGQLTAALVVVVAVVGGGIVLSQRDQGPAHLGLRSFSPIPGSMPLGYGLITDVLPYGSQLLAAGGSQAGGTSSGAVWTSSDGLTWIQASSPLPIGGTIAFRLATDGQTIVALGEDCLPTGQTVCGISHIWRSEDGRSWTTVRSALGSCCGSGVGVGYIGLAHGRSAGFVLAGGAYALPASGGSLIGAAIATSPDGLAWHLASPSDPALRLGSIGGVVDGPAGLVAIGATRASPTTQDPYPTPSVWTSPDGTTWTRSFLSTASQDAVFLNDVAASPTLYVAAGRDGSSAATWVSSDGRSWRESPASPSLADGTVHRVVWLGDAFVAIGQSRFGDVGDGLAWVSTDGLSWTRLDTGTLLTGVEVLSVGEINSRLVLFGTDSNHAGAIVGLISGAP
jgi:hypothetical protein